MRKPVVVRVDGNAPIGMGHVTRCSVLVAELGRLGFGPFRFVTKDYPPGVEFFRSREIDPVIIPSDAGRDEETRAIREVILKEGACLIVFDLLELDNDFVEGSCPEKVLPVALFDLPEPPILRSPLVFNHNVVWKSGNQATVGMSNYFGGPDYVILSPAFEQMRDSYAFSKDIRRLFLNQGGGDPYNLTGKILTALLPLRERLQVDVVLGGAFAYWDDLSKVLRQWEGRCTLYENIPHAQVAELMSKADCAHSASGNMLYELLTLGVPTIAVSHHRNHEIVADYFAERGAIAHLGIGTQIDESDLLRGTTEVIDNPELRKQFYTVGRSQVDGHGAQRTARQILEHL